MIALIIILSIALGICIYVISNLLKQVSILESSLQDMSKIEDEALSIYDFFLRLFTRTLTELEQVDRRGAFASDDEVGFVFNTILESIKQVKFKIEQLKTNPDDEMKT